MLLRKIYMMCLESSSHGFLDVSIGDSAISLKNLDIFIRGYGQCERDLELEFDSWTQFTNWLQPLGYYPCEGWAAKVIAEVGDGPPAFDRFKELLYNYLESELPQWFIEFNLSEQPSCWYGIGVEIGDDGEFEIGAAVPKSMDIRIEKHIKLSVKEA